MRKKYALAAVIIFLGSAMVSTIAQGNEGNGIETPACQAENLIEADHYVVPLGASLELAKDTHIRATTIQIMGTLTTLDATLDNAAADLCLEAESIIMGPSALVRTGNGLPGFNGGDGTDGGSLTLHLTGNPTNALQISPGGHIAVGSGGDGGLVLTQTGGSIPEPCFLLAAVLAKIDSSLNAEQLAATLCQIEPTQANSSSIINCEDLFYINPGPGIPSIDSCFILGLLTPCVEALVGELPRPQVAWCVSSMPDPCDGTIIGIHSQGGAGGNAGTLTLDGVDPVALRIPDGAIALGDGGDGGSAIVMSGPLGDGRTAYGGLAGDSTVVLNGVDARTVNPESSYDLKSLFSSIAPWFTGGVGGDGGDASIGNFNSGIVDECVGDVRDPCNNYPGAELIYCTLEIIQDYCTLSPFIQLFFETNYERQLVDGVLCETQFGDKGDSAAVTNNRYTGPSGQGSAGQNGADGQPRLTGGVSYPWGVSASITCLSSSPAEDGQSANDMSAPGDGQPSDAQANPGGYGFLKGGDGGAAYVHGAAGGKGATGGSGGNGAHSYGICGHEFERAGHGGDGQKGGNSGSGEAMAGDGGPSFLQGGAGGSASAKYGDAGVGGNGGNGGKVATWQHSYYTLGPCSMSTPYDHGALGHSCTWIYDYNNGLYISTWNFDSQGDRGCRGKAGTQMTITRTEGDGGPNAVGQRGPDGSRHLMAPANTPPTDGQHGTGAHKYCA